MERIDITKVVGAGIMVIAAAATLAGVYQLAQRAPPPSPAVAPEPRPSTVAAPPQPRHPGPTVAEKLDELRRQPGSAREALPRNTRCIGGTLFQVEGDAWTNIGRC